MLPDYNTCVDRIRAYNQTGVYRKQIREISTSLPQLKFGFRDFWNYKTGVETEGCNILDAKYLSDTALKLHDFLDSWGMRRSRIAEPKDIEQILNKISPYYNQIQSIKLGSGQMCHYGKWIEAIYRGLDGITNVGSYLNNESSITGKSKSLLAIWGQTPGFDSFTRSNFLRWTHSPDPLKLRQLHHGEEWYKPNEFFDMIVDLDEWILIWSKDNGNRSFPGSFSNLCTGLPVGRIIDEIYNWEFECEPLKWYLFLLKKQGRREASLSFMELEGVLGFDLCKSAYEDMKWWEDNIVKLLEKAQKKALEKGNSVWTLDKLDIQGQNAHFALAVPASRGSMINDISPTPVVAETITCIAAAMPKKQE